MYGLTVPAKQFTQIQVPMNFSYVANNNSDITCGFFLRLLSLRMQLTLTPRCFQGRTGTTPAETRGNSQTTQGQVRSFVIYLYDVIADMSLLPFA